MCLEIDEKEQLYTLNMNSQKITRLLFIESNLVASAETEMRLLDIGGKLVASHFIDKNNGVINDMHIEGEHLFIVTSQKHMVLFDILQQKRVGGYFNDFTFAPKDKLPDEKGLTCVTSGNDGLFVAVGGENGNIYILKN